MRRRGSPVLLITVAIIMVAGLTMINTGMAPPKDEHAVPTDNHEGEDPGGTRTSTGPAISPDQLNAQIEAAGSGGAPKVHQPTTTVEIRDRDDEGSGFWWTDKSQPTKGR